MDGNLDLPTAALIIAVAALFIWYFWHTATSMIKGGKVLSAYLDSRAQRQRLELEREAKFGRYPLWYRAAQKLVLAILFSGSAYYVWKLVQG